MATETCFLKNKPSEKSVVDHAFNIIDSKIQYLDHQTKGILNPILSKDNSDVIVGEAISDSSLSPQKIEQLFLLVEQQSRRKKLLLQLRSLLRSNNALLILALLTDNMFLEFNEQEIHYILDVKSSKQVA